MPMTYQGLSPEQIAAGRNYLNTQYANIAPDGGWKFNGDFNVNQPGFNSNDEASILGATQAMGWNDQDLAQILDSTGAMTGDAITGYRSSNPLLQGSNVDTQSVNFAISQGFTTPEDYRRAQFGNDDNWMGWSGGAEGGYAPGTLRPRDTIDNGTDAQGPRWSRGGQGQTGGTGAPGPAAPVPAPNLTPPALNTQYQTNPYLSAQITGIGDQISRQFNEQIVPGLRQTGVQAGTYGSAKSDVAEGMAARGAAEAFTNASTGLLANDYKDWSARELAKYQGDQSYDMNRGQLGLGYLNANNQYNLGQRGLDVQRYGIDTNNATQRYGIDASAATSRYGVDANNATQRYGIDANTGLGYYTAGNNFYLGNQGQNQNFYTAQRGQDLQQTALGAQIYGNGVQGEWSPYSYLNSIYQPYTGYGSTTQGDSGFDYSRAIGNGLGIYQGLTARPGG